VVLVIASVAAASLALGLTVVGPMIQRRMETPPTELAVASPAPAAMVQAAAPPAEVHIKERVIPRPKPKPIPADLTIPLGAPDPLLTDPSGGTTTLGNTPTRAGKARIRTTITDADSTAPAGASAGSRSETGTPRTDVSVTAAGDAHGETARSHETVVPKPTRRLSPLEALPALGSALPKGQSLGGESSPGSAAGSSPDTRTGDKRDATNATTATDRTRSGHSFRVQVGRFVNESDALRLKDELAGSGLSPRVVRTERDGTVVYRVQVGTYRRRENAERQIEQLKAQSYEPDIVDEAP